MDLLVQVYGYGSIGTSIWVWIYQYKYMDMDMGMGVDLDIDISDRLYKVYKVYTYWNRYILGGGGRQYSVGILYNFSYLLVAPV